MTQRAEPTQSPYTTASWLLQCTCDMHLLHSGLLMMGLHAAVIRLQPNWSQQLKDSTQTQALPTGCSVGLTAADNTWPALAALTCTNVGLPSPTSHTSDGMSAEAEASPWECKVLSLSGFQRPASQSL